MEQLPKETIERISTDAKEYSLKQGVNYPVDLSYKSMITSQIRGAFKDGAQSEALRSLSEIEELKNKYEEAVKYSAKRDAQLDQALSEIEKLKEELELMIENRDSIASTGQHHYHERLRLESQNKELMEALREANIRWNNHNANYTCHSRNSEY